MDEGIGSKIKRIMHSYQLLFSNVTSKAKSTRHVYIYKMTCMFLTTFIFKSLSPFRIPGLWMQVYILCLSSSRSSFNPFSFYRRGLQEQGTMMVDFMPYASLTVCIIYNFPVILVVSLVIRLYHEKNEKTYVTDSIGPTAYRPSLVSCTFTCFHIPFFFPSVRF